jgi:hypothetical protein
MFRELLNQLINEKKILLIGLFLFFSFIYVRIDLNAVKSYESFIEVYGVLTFSIHIILNIIMSFLSAILVGVSYINYKMNNSEKDGSIMSVVSVLFGTVTYGCTACVYGFFAAIGITFTVVALPLSNLPYKLISLGIIIAGLYWTKYRVNTLTCEVK